jgi:glycosyltransferase involved in cell wall biosynthesis
MKLLSDLQRLSLDGWVFLRESPSMSPLRKWVKEFPLSARLIARIQRHQVTLSFHHRHALSECSAGLDCPSPLYDAGGAKVGDRLYIIRGYRSLESVNDKIFVFNLSDERWEKPIDPPLRLAHSHAAICSDGARFLYCVSGQLGQQCHPATTDGFAFDTHRLIWQVLPDLPAPRYAGTMQLLGDRLHFVGGALPDRYTPASDHWSLAIEDGRAVDDHWRDEPPVPQPAMHRGSAVISGALYLFGGQQGDFVAIPNDPNFTCTGKTKETYLPDTYCYCPQEARWTRLSDMLVPASHTDFSVVAAGDMVHVIGGQIYKHPEHFRLRLTDLIQTYDVAADRWSISGYLPYRLKSPICGAHDDTLYCSTGQRDRNSASDEPGHVTATTWRIPLSRLGRAPPRVAEKASMPTLNGKKVVMVSHEFTLSGAPLLLVETAEAMRASGAIVRLFTLADDARYGHLAEHYQLPVLPIETAVAWAARADLVIANSMKAGPWIRDSLLARPSMKSRLVWWNHENSPEDFGYSLAGTDAIETMLFDSHAAQACWEASGLRLPSRRVTVHPGNRDELCRSAGKDVLWWPDIGKRLGRRMARERLGLREEDFLLLCVGEVISKKGQLLLLGTVGKLLAQQPDLPIRLLLVGFRNEMDRRMTLLSLSPAERKAVLNGRLLHTVQPVIDIFYKVADAFVMNSQGHGEPFGRVTIEAMAFGLPVLGTNAGGTPEIVVEGETGLLHPVGDAGLEILAANILRLTNDRSYAKRLGLAGQIRANEHFSFSRMCHDLEEALTPILG